MKKLTWPFIFLFVAAILPAIIVRTQTKKLSNEKQANVPSVKNASFVDTPKIKTYCVQNTGQEWQSWIGRLEIMKGQFKKTDLPARDVQYLCDSIIIPMQTQILDQVRAQMSRDTSEIPQHKPGK